LGLCLVIQVVTGIVLAIHYTPEVGNAYDSCLHISRNVNYGWVIRRRHANGASFFFLYMYLHVGRGIYYAGYRLWKT